MDDVSALVDDELRGGELAQAVGRLVDDPAAAAQWGRYHFIRDALSDHLPLGANPGLADRVRAAIAAEPVSLARGGRRRPPSLPYWRPVAALAAAASVAAVAVLLVAERGEAPPQLAAAGIPVPTVGVLATDARPDPDLDPYLVNHMEYSRTPGLHGMLPYVRLVGHE